MASNNFRTMPLIIIYGVFTLNFSSIFKTNNYSTYAIGFKMAKPVLRHC